MLKESGKAFLHQLKKTLQHKYFWLIIFLLIAFLSYYRINLINKSKYNGFEKEFKLTVIEKKYQDNRYTVILKEKEKLIVNTKEFPYDVGDIVYVKGDLEVVQKNTIPNTFNYHAYLQSRGINWQLKIRNIELIKNNSNLWNKIKNKVISRIETIKDKEYLYAFLMGDTSYFSSDIKDKYQLIGLNFVLAIGSLQVIMIVKVLEKMEEKLRITNKKKLVINTFMIGFYIIFTNCIIGVLRSGLCYVFKSVLNYKKVKFKYYNIIALVGIILLIINPYYINNIGFLYSFFISLGINLLKKSIKGSYYKQFLSISLIAFIIGLPITMYSNYEINFLSCIFSFILAPVFNFLLFPLSIIVLIFPFAEPFFSFVINIIEKIINIFSKLTFLTFVFRKPSMIVSILYYLVIILVLQKKKYCFLLILMLLFHININKLIKENMVTFLDVGEGDAIILKNNSHISLIDTGGSIYSNYSEKIIKYTKSLGINKIDYMILTHGDFDHMGEAINLVNNFKVEKVIFNCGPYNDLEKDLIKVLDKKNIKYYSCIKELNIDNNILYFLQTKEYGNENDNSNVIYTELNGYKFMFTGDAGKAREKDILDKYNISDIDVLKVGHHGSKTSSSRDLIDGINPKYSIISVGKNNKYGHPNKEVLKTLENSKIYRTDKDGSIMFKIKNNRLKIETCSP